MQNLYVNPCTEHFIRPQRSTSICHTGKQGCAAEIRLIWLAAPSRRTSVGGHAARHPHHTLNYDWLRQAAEFGSLNHSPKACPRPVNTCDLCSSSDYRSPRRLKADFQERPRILTSEDCQADTSPGLVPELEGEEISRHGSFRK